MELVDDDWLLLILMLGRREKEVLAGKRESKVCRTANSRNKGSLLNFGDESY